MGQQQLLLLVLTVVIVGVAVIVGIDMFDEMAKQRHVDLIVNYAVQISSEAVTWRRKASPFLGGGGSYSDLDTNGMEQLIIDEVRVPGTFKITKASGDDLEVTGVSNDFPQIGVRVVVLKDEIVETVVAYDGSITLP